MQAVKDIVAGKSLPKNITTNEGVFPAEFAAAVFPSRTY